MNRLLFISGLLLHVLAVAACDLPPLPLFDRPDMASDQGYDGLDGFARSVVCAPRSKICVGNAVRTCSTDGLDFELQACGSGETCQAGGCRAISDSCVEGQNFSLSATELTFEVSSDYKTQTKEVRLTSCGTRPLLVRSADVRGPERPDGTPVFTLPTEYSQIVVPPGESVDIRVTYRPTAGLSHVAGRLELGLVGDELTNVEVLLRSKANCIAVTPFIDLGVVTDVEGAEGTGWVQNCGTEAVALTRVLPGARLGAVVGAELPTMLDPGEELPFDVQLPPNPELGEWTDVVGFEVDGTTVSTRIRGFVERVDCIDLPAPIPTVLVNNLPGDPRPGSALRFVFPSGDPDQRHWMQLVSQPDGSHQELRLTGDAWSMRPQVIGTYSFAVRTVETSSRRASCKTGEFDVVVAPGAPFHVELTWRSVPDAIPSDLGFGTGVNLDLHVLTTETEVNGTWNDPVSDCFPGILGACGLADGRISGSESGGVPEYASMNLPEGVRFEVGTYLANPFNFEGVEARVRVFVGGVEVADLREADLQSANDFWLVGIYGDGAWASVDRTFSGFPR